MEKKILKLKYFRKGSIRKWVPLTFTHLSRQPFTSTRHFHTRASPYQSTKSITETRHSITIPSLRRVTSTQIRQFHTNSSFLHKNWRIFEKMTDFGGWKGVTLLWKWRVEVTSVWKWGVRLLPCFKKRGPKITSIRTVVTKFYLIIV